MRVGSVCTGIGGLDLAVGGDLAYVAETDARASEVLAERFGAPNVGDWTELDSFGDIDTLIGGLPCQPVSGAGRGRGDGDERYLYDDLVRILSADRVPTLVLENVRGFLYPRHGELWWRLIRSLAQLGYVGRYGVVRASDAGAPHRRERWFCVARHTDTLGRSGRTGHFPEAGGGYEPADAGDAARHADSASAGRERGGLPRSQGSGRSDGGIGDGLADAAPTTADADEPGSQGWSIGGQQRSGKWVAGAGGVALHRSDYGLAIARWEHVLGRDAPAPLDGRRLSPRFVEWMMGLPDGWVTGLDHPRTSQLKMLGNAVVPQQAHLALSLLEAA